MATIWIYDISIQRWDTYTLPLEFTQEVDGEESAINLTGITLYMTIKRSLDDTDDTDALLQKVVTSHDTPLSWLSHFKLTPEETRALPSEEVLYYDVQLKDTLDDIYTYFRGTFTTSKDVTITTE